MAVTSEEKEKLVEELTNSNLSSEQKQIFLSRADQEGWTDKLFQEINEAFNKLNFELIKKIQDRKEETEERGWEELLAITKEHPEIKETQEFQDLILKEKVKDFLIKKEIKELEDKIKTTLEEQKKIEELRRDIKDSN
jgi:hypothetical protein